MTIFCRCLPALLCLVLGLTLSACETKDSGQAAMGVVDMDRVLRESQAGKAAVKILEEMQSESQQKFIEIQAKMKEKPGDAELEKELQMTYVNSQQRLQAEQQNVSNIMLDAIQRVMNAYRKEKGYMAIFSSAPEFVCSFDARIDVTNDIIAALDREKVTITPLPQPEPAPKPQTEQDNAAGKNDAEKDRNKPATDKAASEAGTTGSADKKPETVKP